jgi:hypothetical protein
MHADAQAHPRPSQILHACASDSLVQQQPLPTSASASATRASVIVVLRDREPFVCVCVLCVCVCVCVCVCCVCERAAREREAPSLSHTRIGRCDASAAAHLKSRGLARPLAPIGPSCGSSK